jgi:hypothetical protein
MILLEDIEKFKFTDTHRYNDLYGKYLAQQQKIEQDSFEVDLMRRFYPKAKEGSLITIDYAHMKALLANVWWDGKGD